MGCDEESGPTSGDGSLRMEGSMGAVEVQWHQRKSAGQMSSRSSKGMSASLELREKARSAMCAVTADEFVGEVSANEGLEPERKSRLEIN